ncbi:hypothetical protein HAX54_016789 [Datura stramonium]|uniref:Uncharacterized protein n=1 Tax=Datura stramonium TaxID=4076 RepID=A0ABS8UK99_DATST|nr:hypothetical protein [Datura stramonium]
MFTLLLVDFAPDKCSIICQDEGVLRAKVNRRMDDEFLQQAHNNLDLALDFWPQGIKDVDTTSLFTTPLMVVQIAIFQCGGPALSSAAHPAMDGWTNFTFIHEWSKVCKFGVPAEKINFMSFDLANIFGPRDITAMFEASAIFAGKRSNGKLNTPEAANPLEILLIEVPIAYEPKDTKMELQDFIVLIRETVQKLLTIAR